MCSSSTGQGTVTQGFHLTTEAGLRSGARKLLELYGTSARHQCGEHLSTFVWFACTRHAQLWECSPAAVFIPYGNVLAQLCCLSFPILCSLFPGRNLQLSSQLCSLRRKLVAFLMCHF